MECELPEFMSESNPRARKPHQCCECHGTIQPGEQYHYVAGGWAGDFQVYKTCPDCWELRHRLCNGRRADECPGFGWLREECEEHDTTGPLRKLLEIALKRQSKRAESIRAAVERWEKSIAETALRDWERQMREQTREARP